MTVYLNHGGWLNIEQLMDYGIWQEITPSPALGV